MNRVARSNYDLAIDRSRGRARREIVAALGALVVLFNILAAGLLGASAQAAGSPLLGDPSGDGIVICTGAGMIVVDHNGKPIEDKNGAVHSALCPFCLPLMQGHAKAPDLAGLALAPVALRIAPSRDTESAFSFAARLFPGARPRAPPVA
ncbi:DUF2946 domain-containing protein [Rhodoblastus sp.]|uniref:DUF2946 domain-containing protein n=1 Tax=Rhodoblastus sp. TaxID=1962975 RepID=UPI003F960EF2